MRRIILLMTVGALVVVGTLLVVSVAGAQKTSHGHGTKTSNQDGLDPKLQLQAGPHHHQAGDEGQMDQQGQHYAHCHGKQKEII
jgi:hypothetical protein